MTVTLDDLEAAVDALVTGSTFAMAPDALGSEGIRALVADSFPLTAGQWVLTAVDGPRRQGDAVVLTGTSTTLLGVGTPRLTLSFDLADGGLPALLVVLAPADWNPGVSFPSWRDTAPALVGLVLANPRLEWSSVERSGISTGLNLVADEVLKQGTLAALATFPDLHLPDPHGAISGGAAPTTRITTDPSPALSVGGLALPLAFAAVATAEPDSYLEFDSTIAIGHGVPDIPVSMRADELNTYLILDADLTGLTRYALAAFADFLHGAQVADTVKDVLKVPDVIVLRHLSAVIGLTPARLASVAVEVGTGQALDIVPGKVSVPDVSLRFGVEDPTGAKDITARLTGTFRFLDAYDVDISAYYSKSSVEFTGALDPSTPVPLTRIVQTYLPDATWLPDLTLDRLELSAELRAKRYSFGLAVAGDWTIPIGAAALHLTGGSLDLAYQPDTGFDGTLAGTAALTGRGGQAAGSFAGSVAVRKAGFELEGTLSDLSLTALADAFADASVITGSGIAEITVRQAAVVVRKSTDAGATSYEFAAGATIDAEQFGQVRLLFAARKTGTAPQPPETGDGQAGFLAGVVVTPEWNPKSIWCPLGEVFDYVTVRNASLLLSTDRWTQPLPGADGLPYPVEKGVTFAGSLSLTDKALSVLSNVLPPGTELDLAAHIDPANLPQSDIRGTLTDIATVASVQFTKLVVDLAPTKFTLEADLTFTVQGEALHLAGRGMILLQALTMELSVTVEHWVHPLGIQGLTIDEFGLDLAVEDTGLTIGLLGKFLIGTGDDAFTLVLGGELTDFTEPSAFVFALDPKPGHELTLARVVGQFTGTDLDAVPLLEDIAIDRLDCYVVADPNGWTAPDNHLYPKGFGLDAQVRFLGWTIKVKAVVGARGIVAAGSIDPAVTFGDLLQLTDATGTTGPHVDIDTTVLGQTGKTYFDASGRISLLGLTETFSGHADSSGFTFTFTTDLAGLFRTEISATLSTGTGFTGSFAGAYCFDLTLQGDVTVDGITIIPAGVHVEGPDATLEATCAVGPRGASLAAELHLTWAGVPLDADMGLAVDARVLADLPRAIATWISGHAEQFFKAVLDDVEAWLTLLVKGVLWVGQTAVDVVEALFVHFAQSVVDIADALLELGRFDLDTMAEALVEVCGITWERALELLEKKCAITRAANAL
ncbi:hypothetical protein [Saccharothrix texasensis]|uniref:Uncharacterized protein n=1 Tax=Saccharothrix texasensis TaxID=103734 RepID=A0A3N1GX15_9PSEU|nr:hypothetical protein [Saccharothrix texasensis]ROP34843.1 hypothetical protein EDD40_0047 [Saccharothrix texasensis]